MNPVHVAAGGLVLVLAGFGAGWTANGWRLDAELAALKTEHAQQRAAQAAATVITMQDDAKAISTAARDLSAIQNTLGPKFDALRKEVQHATKASPLPPDCRPDDVRVRNLETAIDAANKAATR